MHGDGTPESALLPAPCAACRFRAAAVHTRTRSHPCAWPRSAAATGAPQVKPLSSAVEARQSISSSLQSRQWPTETGVEVLDCVQQYFTQSVFIYEENFVLHMHTNLIQPYLALTHDCLDSADSDAGTGWSEVAGLRDLVHYRAYATGQIWSKQSQQHESGFCTMPSSDLSTNKQRAHS